VIYGRQIDPGIYRELVTSATKLTITGIRSEFAANSKHLVWKKIGVASYYVLPYFAGKTLLPTYLCKENGLLRGSSKLCEGAADVYFSQ
jgi:hypothetical protein